jgi:hypothetical protein
MKHLSVFLLLMLAGLGSALTNDALPDILEARYDYVACDVDYAKDWLSMREDCGDQENVPVFDSSEYVEELEEDLDDLKDAAEDADRLEYGLSMVRIGADSLDLIGAVFKDALNNKTLKFFSCVREGEKPLKQDRDDCREDALDGEKAAAKDYVDNEIEYANGQIDDLDDLGANTSGMEKIVDYGEELVDDIDDAYESGEIKDIRKLYLRHSRLVLLFRMEKMLAVMDYAKPMIEASNNRNKDEILDDMDDLEDDIEDMLDQCEYSDEVNDNLEYGSDNLVCWRDGAKLFANFNAIRLLILGGAL